MDGKLGLSMLFALVLALGCSDGQVKEAAADDATTEEDDGESDGDGDADGDGDGDDQGDGDGDGDPSDSVCGDGHLDPDEQCDHGSANADNAACTSACTVAVCGDGLVLAGAEVCDDGGESIACDEDCTPALCGDGRTNPSAGEACDGALTGISCTDEGFAGGELSCSDACEYDTQGCYPSLDATFTTCGRAGHAGPTQAQCDDAYEGTALEGAVTVTAGVQTWVVPYTATYTIEAWGAQGGKHNFGSGGKGARMKGEFELSAGQVLKILVGQRGSSGTAFDVGGGGGTFVALDDDTPLIVAGGGGGGGNCSGGYDLFAMIGKSTIGDGSGGVGGNDGLWCGCGGEGSPGGGFTTDGTPSGGDAFVNGGLGDDTQRPGQCVNPGIGGFGGGGNGGNGGGGGGGYSGGDGGGSVGGAAGKGGESYNAGVNLGGEDGVRLGDGEVRITIL